MERERRRQGLQQQGAGLVYTDAAKVKLYFTPKGSTEKRLIGEKSFTKKTTAAGYTYQVYEGADKNSTAHKNMYLTWNVPWAEGTISAEAYDENNKLIPEGPPRQRIGDHHRRGREA